MDISIRHFHTATTCGVKGCGKDAWTEIQAEGDTGWVAICPEHVKELERRIMLEYTRQLSPLFNTSKKGKHSWQTNT